MVLGFRVEGLGNRWSVTGSIEVKVEPTTCLIRLSESICSRKDVSTNLKLKTKPPKTN